MDRRDRQSSLPSSLIPHLYAAPRDSSTRTTLTSHSEDGDQDSSNIASLPPLLPVPPYIHRSSYPSIAVDSRQLPPVPPVNPIHRSFFSSNSTRSVGSTYSNPTLFFPSSLSSHTPVLPSLASLSESWREGEAGPSSLIHPGQRDYDSRQDRRGASQPASVISHPNSFGYGPTSQEPHRQDTGYYPTFSHQSFHDTPISPLPPLQHLSSMEPPLLFDRRDSFSYPQVGSLSISSSSPSNYLRQVSTPELEPSYGSEPLSVNTGSNEGDDGRKNKRRRAHSMDIDDIPKKTSRKTAVACNFCRGRKLRCNGAKPSCYNCTVRKFECEYVSTQRRRGPGKAPKGSRSRKGRLEHSGSSSNVGDRLSTMVPDHQAYPDLGPYMTILSLEKFEFQPPDSSPQYPSERNEPLMRRQGSRSRTSRSSSAEDRSDAKDIHRNQSGS